MGGRRRRNIAIAQRYNARRTYRNLVSCDPDIRIASSTAPGAVRVREDAVYARPGGLSRAIGLYSPGPHARPAQWVVMVHHGVCGHAAVTVSDRVSPGALAGST